jgi:hypothetical protein
MESKDGCAVQSIPVQLLLNVLFGSCVCCCCGLNFWNIDYDDDVSDTRQFRYAVNGRLVVCPWVEFRFGSDVVFRGLGEYPIGWIYCSPSRMDVAFHKIARDG